jgi:purine-nucleoside phosphorylase
MAAGMLKQKLSHQEVMETTQRVGQQFVDLVLGVLARLG